jgi:hypothetical protein
MVFGSGAECQEHEPFGEENSSQNRGQDQAMNKNLKSRER